MIHPRNQPYAAAMCATSRSWREASAPQRPDIHARPRGSPLQELSDRVLLETPTTGWIAIAIDTTKDTLSTTPSGKLLPSA